MNSDLIIMTFPHEDEASQARQALEMMRGKQILGLENTALVTRNRTGKAAVHQRWDLPAYPRDRHTRLPVLFADAVFAPSAEQRAEGGTGVGLDERFVEEVGVALLPGGSALVIYIPPESIVDTRRLLDTLALFHGRLHHTSIPAQVENAILSATEIGKPDTASPES